MATATANGLSMKDAASIASYAYGGAGTPPIGFNRISNSYYKLAYQKVNAEILQQADTNVYVISFRGTASADDLVSDSYIAGGLRPPIADVALAYVRDFISKNPNANVILDGHSLGGFLATDVAARLSDVPPVGLGVGSISAVGFDVPTIPNAGNGYAGAAGSYANIVAVNLTSDPVSSVTLMNGGNNLGRVIYVADSNVTPEVVYAQCTAAADDYATMVAFLKSGPITSVNSEAYKAAEALYPQLAADVNQCTSSALAAHQMVTMLANVGNDNYSIKSRLDEIYGTAEQFGTGNPPSLFDLLRSNPATAARLTGALALTLSKIGYGEGATAELPLEVKSDGSSVLGVLSTDGLDREFYWNAASKIIAVEATNVDGSRSVVIGDVGNLVGTEVASTNSDLQTALNAIGDFDNNAAVQVAFNGTVSATGELLSGTVTQTDTTDQFDWTSKSVTLAFPIDSGSTGTDGVIVGEATKLDSGATVTMTRNPATNGPTTTWTTTVQRAFDHSSEITGSQIGSIFGSSLGQAIGGDNIFAQIGAGAGLSAVLSTLGGGIGHYFDDTKPANSGLEQGAFDALGNFNANLKTALQSQSIGALSGFLTGELADALHLGNGVGAGLLRSVTGSVTNTVLTNVANGAVGANIFSGLSGSVTTGIGSFLGSYLAHQIVTPNTQAAAISGSIGGSLGSIAAIAAYGGTAAFTALGTSIGSAIAIGSFGVATLLNIGLAIAIPGIGALIGTVLGTLLGNLFGGGDEGYGNSDVTLVAATGLFANTANRSDDRDFGDPAVAMAQNAASVINQIIAATGGTVSARGAVTLLFSNATYDDHNTAGVTVTRATLAEAAPGAAAAEEQLLSYTSVIQNSSAIVTQAVLGAVKNTQITGGDLYIRRALADTHATTIEQLGAEIQIAQDYGRYLANKDVIDTIIAQDPASAFAAGWVITLLRAEELGITHIQRSDFNGGMADFLGSFDLSRFAADFENVAIAVSGTSMTLTLNTGGTAAPKVITINNYATVTGLTNVTAPVSATGSLPSLAHYARAGSFGATIKNIVVPNDNAPWTQQQVAA